MILEIKQNQPDRVFQQLWQQLIKTFQKDCSIESVQQNQVNFISLLKNDAALLTNNRAIVSLKYKSNCILMEAYGLGNLSQYKKFKNHLQIVQKINQNLSKDDVAHWVQQNNNFGVKRIVLYDYFKESSLLQISNYLETSRKILQSILNTCIIQLSQTFHESKQNATKQAFIKKKLQKLELLKYQYEVNRRKRSKSTAMDFNNSKIKSLLQIIQMRQICKKNGKNYFQALKQSFCKNQIKQNLATEAFNKLKIKYQQKTKQRNLKKAQTQKILHAIQVISQIELNGCNIIQGSFSHIQLVQSNYRVIFSTKIGTNAHVVQQRKENIQMKQETCVLIKKNKCQGCDGQTHQRTIINKKVFQNQAEILLILNERQNNSICNYYIKQFESLNQIDTIYCKRLPYDPIQIYFLDKKNLSHSLKHLQTILKFLLQVAEGVNFLNQNSIIHRDLKPSNIMLDSAYSAKIIDFGSSCPSQHAEVQVSLGFDFTLRSSQGYYVKYQSLNEQIRNKYQKQEYDRHLCFDVYSFGVIFQHLLKKLQKSKDGLIQGILQNMQYLVKKCKDPHPDDRIVPLQVCVLLSELEQICSKLCS